MIQNSLFERIAGHGSPVCIRNTCMWFFGFTSVNLHGSGCLE
jgi:hypothetical protein